MKIPRYDDDETGVTGRGDKVCAEEMLRSGRLRMVDLEEKSRGEECLRLYEIVVAQGLRNMSDNVRLRLST